MKINYKLPEKWYVRRTEFNQDALNNWANSQPEVQGHTVADGYIHSHNFGLNGWSGDGHHYADKKAHPDYTLISFEDFKKYVLDEFTEPEESTPENYDYLIPILKDLQ